MRKVGGRRNASKWDAGGMADPRASLVCRGRTSVGQTLADSEMGGSAWHRVSGASGAAGTTYCCVRADVRTANDGT